MTSRDLQAEVREAIALQEHANARVLAALRDEEFMADVIESREEANGGERGELLADVIKRLKLV